MDNKNRKFLSRFGAALMLGMSLFNFGMIWGRQNAERIPRKTRNMRKQTAETDIELQEIASIAEKEAQIVMATEQINARDNQQQLQEEATIVSPKFFRYVAITLWVFSASVLFSSTVFNYPFVVGKGVLALLPGVPHVAKISLNSSSEQHVVGQQASVLAYLDTNGYEVDFVRMAVDYDPESFSFEGYDFDKGKFDVVEERIIDDESGKLILSLKNKKGGTIVSGKRIATINFKTIQKKAKNKISIKQDESAVVNARNKKNILGKTRAASLVVSE